MRHTLPTAVRRNVQEALRADPARALLVEGPSDEAAVLALAGRLGRDLRRERTVVVVADGATNFGHLARALGPAGAGLALAGLFDRPEEAAVRRGLHDAGIEVPPGRDGLAAKGFHVCVDDLEDELLRALGLDRVLEVVAEQGEAGAFRTFQRQPFQRARPLEAQLHRWIGIRSGRKVRYGRVLVEALEKDRIPESLVAVLAPVRG